jgi:hydrogenase expression/formation protein HypE
MARVITGKIPHGLLGDLLARLTPPGREVVVGPTLGEDACAIDTGRDLLVASSDPITFTAHHIGYYSVNVNANDVATMGARPRWFLAALLFPPGTRKAALRRIFDELDTACDDLGIRMCGGHTEATGVVTKPVIAGTMLGTVGRRRLVRPGRTRAGDRVLLTKRLALEGTSIIARERRRGVERILGRQEAARARNLLFEPGISVVKEALSAARAACVHAMHDPTEGGLLWGVKELGHATGLGVEIDLDRVPVFEETAAVCDHLGLDPLGLIASGSLLVVVSARDARKVAGAIQAQGIECTDIGRIVGRGLWGIRRGKRRRLPRLKADEITRLP